MSVGGKGVFWIISRTLNKRCLALSRRGIIMSQFWDKIQEGFYTSSIHPQLKPWSECTFACWEDTEKTVYEQIGCPSSNRHSLVTCSDFFKTKTNFKRKFKGKKNFEEGGPFFPDFFLRRVFLRPGLGATAHSLQVGDLRFVFFVRKIRTV